MPPRARRRQLPFITRIFAKLCPRIGATLCIEPEFGYVGQITFKSGKRTFFRNRNSSINAHGAVEIARDKNYTSFFLRQMGYNVPEERTFFAPAFCAALGIRRDVESAVAYARTLGFPVIVKPNHLSQGVLVSKAWTAADVRRTVRAVLRKDNVALVQRWIPGRDYRVVVLDGEVLSAYERSPLEVTGDGRRSIAALLAAKQRAFVAQGRDTVIDATDGRLLAKLQRQGRTLRSIPKRGERVALLDNANLSTGGDSRDVTGSIHPHYQALAAAVARDMELRLCGIDIITSDITQPLDPAHVVLEVNAAPGLDHYASSGRRQQRVVEELYLRVLLALERGTP